jgi:hypothetical protein
MDPFVAALERIARIAHETCARYEAGGRPEDHRAWDRACGIALRAEALAERLRDAPASR